MSSETFGSAFPRLNRAALRERDGHLLFCPPSNVAGLVASVWRQDQGEVLGNINRTCYAEPGSGLGHIASHAIDGVVADQNRSGSQHAMARGRAPFHDLPLMERLLEPRRLVNVPRPERGIRSRGEHL